MPKYLDKTFIILNRGNICYSRNILQGWTGKGCCQPWVQWEVLPSFLFVSVSLSLSLSVSLLLLSISLFPLLYSALCTWFLRFLGAVGFWLQSVANERDLRPAPWGNSTERSFGSGHSSPLLGLLTAPAEPEAPLLPGPHGPWCCLDAETVTPESLTHKEVRGRVWFRQREI